MGTISKITKAAENLESEYQRPPNEDEIGKQLEMQGEEVTDRWKSAPVHMNATNLRELIKPQGGNSVYEVMQRNMNALAAQRKATGQPMFLHLNHPNFGWGVTAEDLMKVKGEQFFEVYNGHPAVRNLEIKHMPAPNACGTSSIPEDSEN